MSTTTFSGPVLAGDKRVGESGGPNIGSVLLTQVMTVSVDATLVQNTSINLPINSAIVFLIIDVITPYDSASTAALTIGTSSGAQTYLSSRSAKTEGRTTTQTLTGAQLLAMSNIGTNTTVVATVTSQGQPTVGLVRITCQYIQAA